MSGIDRILLHATEEMLLFVCQERRCARSSERLEVAVDDDAIDKVIEKFLLQPACVRLEEDVDLAAKLSLVFFEGDGLLLADDKKVNIAF